MWVAGEVLLLVLRKSKYYMNLYIAIENQNLTRQNEEQKIK